MSPHFFSFGLIKISIHAQKFAPSGVASFINCGIPPLFQMVRNQGSLDYEILRRDDNLEAAIPVETLVLDFISIRDRLGCVGKKTFMLPGFDWRDFFYQHVFTFFKHTRRKKTYMTKDIG